MPKVPSSSPATGKPTVPSFVHTTAGNFVDNAGRTLLLRGVNLSGSSKAPVGQQSQVLQDFWESAEAGGESFVGRPLNLDDGSADVHLTRLRGWGFNMLRFLVFWEALEHAGPGIYDYEFMDYTIRVLQKCREYGFRVYIDSHQDAWSRFSGGSGAPFWTLPACGINPRNFTATQAAIVHCEYPFAHAPEPATLPAMIWSTNYGRLVSQTMYTLFFAGKDFAPNCIIDGKNIQDYLQEHYIEAFGQLADRIRAFENGSLFEECVIGWDSLNEPFEGLCSWEDLSANPTTQGSTAKKGTYPTPAQSLRLGMGEAQKVENYKFGSFGPTRDGSVTIDPKGLTIWADANMEQPDGVNPRWGWTRDTSRWSLGTCLWALHGVWDVETGFILRPDYFKYSPTTGKLVDFIEDYFKPHFVAWARRVRASHPEAILFVQPPVFAQPPKIGEEILKGRCAYSPHYYDGLTLMTRHWNWFNADALGILRGKYKNKMLAVKIGERAIRQSFQDQLGMLKADADILKPQNGDGEGKVEEGKGYPVMISEIGTPFDMDGKRSYGWTDGGRHKGDYRRQEKALDASLNAADGPNSLNWAVWTYCPDNSHDWGDGWNLEDLSLWSLDDSLHKCSDKQPAVDCTHIPGGLDVDPATMIYNPEAGSSEAVLLGSTAALVERQDSAAASSITLGSAPSMPPTAEMTTELSNTSSSSMLRNWLEDPYSFLRDGARAVRAFSRPWPHKVVGVPVDMKFEIDKAYFRLIVRVSSEDRPLSSLSPLSVSEDVEENEKEVPATEVYVPLVHYASDALVKKRRVALERTPKGENRKTGESARGVNNEFAHAFSSGQDSGKTSCLSSRFSSTVELPTLSESDAASIMCRPPLQGDSSLLGSLMDLDVKVSTGRWDVDGQVLKWWYDVPSEGEGDREYTIEIKRRNGKIKSLEKKWWARWCERLCGCLLM